MRHKQTIKETKMMCYRKNDRAMRPIMWVPLMLLHRVGLESSSTVFLWKIFSLHKISPCSPGSRWMGRMAFGLRSARRC